MTSFSIIPDRIPFTSVESVRRPPNLLRNKSDGLVPLPLVGPQRLDAQPVTRHGPAQHHGVLERQRSSLPRGPHWMSRVAGIRQPVVSRLPGQVEVAHVQFVLDDDGAVADDVPEQSVVGAGGSHALDHSEDPRPRLAVGLRFTVGDGSDDGPRRPAALPPGEVEGGAVFGDAPVERPHAPHGNVGGHAAPTDLPSANKMSGSCGRRDRVRLLTPSHARTHAA